MSEQAYRRTNQAGVGELQQAGRTAQRSQHSSAAVRHGTLLRHGSCGALRCGKLLHAACTVQLAHCRCEMQSQRLVL